MAEKETITVEGQELSVSNLSKLMFPEAGFTKGDLIHFYAEIGAYILPHLKDRPITFKRFPDGIKKDFFYGKNAPSHTPSWVKTASVRHTTKTIRYVLINDLATLLWSANLANIEMHPYLFKARAQNTPTYVVFDLDPGPGCDVFDCIELGLVIRELLSEINLDIYPKVSGSKGLQLYVPLNTKMTFDLTSDFAQTVATKLEELLPDRVVSRMTKDLRNNKVLIDWSQNAQGKTTVSVYSLRAKRGRPFVSLPFSWDELRNALKTRKESALYLEPAATMKRLKKLGDLFAPVLVQQQTLTKKHIQGIANLRADTALPAPSRQARSNATKAKTTPAAKTKQLGEYDRKRDFTKTSEPSGKVASSETGTMFVMQKHKASQLHFDFRLEMDGVLKSWAVPKGPPLETSERRLAMHVEDHPLDYASFEGTIPAGEYGGGTVMVWDFGTYTVESGKPYAAYKKGKITVHLSGSKLKGEWTLVKDSRDDRRWLMMKSKSATVVGTKASLDRSAQSQRTLVLITKQADAVWKDGRKQNAKQKTAAPAKQKRAKKVKSEEPPLADLPKKTPSFLSPMKAELSATIPVGKEWLYEVKYDGYRALISKSKGEINVWSRNGNTFNKRFASVVSDAQSVEADTFLIDGEIVAQSESGQTSFQALQNFRSVGGHTLAYYAFDLLNVGGYSLLGRPLSDRRALLEQVIKGSDLHLSKAFDVAPQKLAAHVAKIGLEGIIAKRADSLYTPGTRTEKWLKYKVVNEQELVIGGYSKKTFSTFSTLLVGFYERGKLHYAGKVNGGFTPDVRRMLLKKMTPLVRTRCPFANLPEESEGRWGSGITASKMHECTWLKPELVGVIRFTEWTDNNHLRHSAFVSLRDDKTASEVRR